jgi:hypothetical protein
MATEAQIKANRRNSKKSTGPKSPEGKAVVSKNAVKHGLFASENVIKGEKQADFDHFHDEMLSKLAPVGPVESMLAERFISLSWRLNRVGRMQNQAIDVMIERDGPSPLTKQLRASLPKFIRDIQDDPRGSGPELVLGRAAIKDYSNSRVLDRLLMYERRIENSMIKMMDQLYKLRLIRELKENNSVVNQKSRCKMQNHNVKFKNSAFRPIRPDSAEDPGAAGDDLKKQSQSPACGAKPFALVGYENKPLPGLRENQSNFPYPHSRLEQEEEKDLMNALSRTLKMSLRGPKGRGNLLCIGQRKPSLG